MIQKKSGPWAPGVVRIRSREKYPRYILKGEKALQNAAVSSSFLIRIHPDHVV